MYVDMFMAFRPVHVAMGMEERSNDTPVFRIHGARAQLLVQKLVSHEGQRQLQMICLQKAPVIQHIGSRAISDEAPIAKHQAA